MTFKTYEDLGQGITRIDTGMIHEGLAALYLVGSEDEWALVETGTQHSIATIMALLQARGIDPMQVKYIIPTHVHLDHAGGVGGRGGSADFSRYWSSQSRTFADAST